MSRIGKQPVILPSGFEAQISASSVTIKSPKGSLTMPLGRGVAVSQGKGELNVAVTGADKQSRANFGTTRALLSNMVKGLSTGWKRVLEMNGVGFVAKVNGQTLILTVGFSHDVIVEIPKEVKCVVTKNIIELESANKELVSNLAANIRKVQPPEPYLGKGIKYQDEKVRRKAGKTGKK